MNARTDVIQTHECFQYSSKEKAKKKKIEKQLIKMEVSEEFHTRHGKGHRNQTLILQKVTGFPGMYLI